MVLCLLTNLIFQIQFCNIDYDEFIFYHDGEFFSREGIKEGMITLHPAGSSLTPFRQVIK